MAVQLKEIMPWGRSFEEYVAMFALSEEDLSKRILGCGDGPASFNAELTRRGRMAVLRGISPESGTGQCGDGYARVLKAVFRGCTGYGLS
jgi:hypothetical protein